MTEALTSAANPHIRSLSRLKTRRGRRAAGAFLIEGTRELSRAIAAGRTIDEIIFCPSIASQGAAALAGTNAALVTTVAEIPFAKLTVRRGPDGIIGVAPIWEPTLAAIERDLVLIAEAVEKPGNLGAMLRTADGAGAAVVATDPTVDLFNPNVIRASQGSLFTVPVAVGNADEVVRWATGRGSVVVLAPDAGSPLWKTDLTGPVAIVVGSEHAGLTDRWLDLGAAVRIPMVGEADSLNASVAAAIVLYEAVRQRSSVGH